jgi:hypothetical protein
MMKLSEVLQSHKEKFRQKFIEALAKKNSLSMEETESEFKNFIEHYVEDRYRLLEQLVERINEIKKPVFLIIRRDRMREDRCKICESNEPNVREIEKKYGDRIELFEVVEDRHEGALYQIIFHEEAEEKKLPLTAVINNGDILKFWAGKTVDASVYEMFLNRLV